MTARLRVVAAVVFPDGTERRFVVTGQIGRTLKALVAAGPRGVTSLDIAATWALRTSHYVFVLRRLGLEIEMRRELHEGPAGTGWHGRYILRSKVRIFDNAISGNAQPGAEAA